MSRRYIFLIIIIIMALFYFFGGDGLREEDMAFDQVRTVIYHFVNESVDDGYTYCVAFYLDNVSNAYLKYPVYVTYYDENDTQITFKYTFKEFPSSGEVKYSNYSFQQIYEPNKHWSPDYGNRVGNDSSKKYVLTFYEESDNLVNVDHFKVTILRRDGEVAIEKTFPFRSNRIITRESQVTCAEIDANENLILK